MDLEERHSGLEDAFADLFADDDRVTVTRREIEETDVPVVAVQFSNGTVKRTVMEEYGVVFRELAEEHGLRRENRGDDEFLFRAY